MTVEEANERSEQFDRSVAVDRPSLKVHMVPELKAPSLDRPSISIGRTSVGSAALPPRLSLHALQVNFNI